jgi:hypothetical protein
MNWSESTIELEGDSCRASRDDLDTSADNDVTCRNVIWAYAEPEKLSTQSIVLSRLATIDEGRESYLDSTA